MKYNVLVNKRECKETLFVRDIAVTVTSWIILIYRKMIEINPVID